ncbi:hypothetical protein [Amycolatopsis circi]|uniref:hypothetical protein n=1 Tax=Amycolatopsis circi TaxID=871959 RepID=UPI000E2717BD|nr:hypothetical protein [Amycolatopsis circi]
MTEPLQLMENFLAGGEASVKASAEAVRSWIELAELARAELARMGIPAAVRTEGGPWAAAEAGAVIEVNAGPPYGVIVKWKPAVVESDDSKDGHLLSAKEFLEETTYAVLSAAYFRTLIDRDARGGCIFRVLQAPYVILE